MRIDGSKVRVARERRGWAAAEFAGHIGVSLQTVYRWEWGKAQPSAKKAQAIALALGVTLASIGAE
jgi:transcriptional regulator with XRE-family HTH domain